MQGQAREGNGAVEAESAPDRERSRPVVLVAVGNSATRSNIREQLTDRGFEVCATGDAQVALAWLQRRRADVVIADVLLPGTRIALPHVLRRRHRSDCPGLVGLAEDADRCDEIRSALSYDIVMQKGTPAAVLAKSVVTLLASAAERQPAAARVQRRAYERATARHLSQLNAPG